MSKYFLTNSETHVRPQIWLHASLYREKAASVHPLIAHKTHQQAERAVGALDCTWREGYISDCYQRLSKDYTAILGSWHVGVFAQFFVHADRLMESVAPLRFSVAPHASKNVVSPLPVDADFGRAESLLALAQGHIRTLRSNVSLQLKGDELLLRTRLSAALDQIIGYVALHEACGMLF